MSGSSGALDLLRAAERNGRFDDRRRGIDLGLQSLATNPTNSDLALHTARALRSLYRTDYAWPLLTYAIGILSVPYLAAWPDTSDRIVLGAELADTLLQVADQLVVRAVGEGEETLASRQAVGLRMQAKGIAALAVQKAEDGSDEYFAALASLGKAHSALGETDEAVRLLEVVVTTDPLGGTYKLDLARALIADAPNDTARPAQLLRESADQCLESHPREAFEAARFHGHWAAGRGAWTEASEAYERALRSRAVLQRLQGGSLTAREWLEEAGPVPSEAACAFVRAGRVGKAVAALDLGLALNLSDRLGRVEVNASLDMPLSRPPVGEVWMFLAVDSHGSVAMVVRSDGDMRALELPNAPYNRLYEHRSAVARAMGAWQRSGRSTTRRLRLSDALDKALAWVSKTMLTPALALVDDPEADLVLITDGRTDLIPLAAVPVDEATLLDQRVVRFAPNVRLLKAARKRSNEAPATVASIAVSAVGGGEALAFASIEARAVAALRSADLLCESSASIAAVEDALARHSTVHLACHAFADIASPLASAFALFDAPLTLSRLMQLGLSHLGLVVASACETAMADIGTPGERYNLASGLLHAGATGVAATNWVLSDRTAFLIALRLHSALRDDPAADPCTALRSAQLWLRDATVTDVVAWLGELGRSLPDDELATEVANSMNAMLDAQPPTTKLFASVLNWACFAYYGA